VARGGGGVGDGRRVGARIGGGTRLVAPAMIVGRASRGRAGAAARPPRRASPRAGGHPRGRKKNKRENQKRGANLTGPGPARAAFSPVHVVRPVQDVAYGPVLLLLVERGRSVGRHRCRRVRTLAQPTRAQIKKRACDLSRSAKFRAPRPDRRARSCRDASVSVDPPRVRLFVRGCEMSEAELGGIPGVVRGALPRKAGECPHAAGRTSNASAKSSNARVIYLLRQTASADRAKRIFVRCAPSRWLASTLTRRALSPVPSSPSLHGAPRLGRLLELTGAPPF